MENSKPKVKFRVVVGYYQGTLMDEGALRRYDVWAGKPKANLPALRELHSLMLPKRYTLPDMFGENDASRMPDKVYIGLEKISVNQETGQILSIGYPHVLHAVWEDESKKEVSWLPVRMLT